MLAVICVICAGCGMTAGLDLQLESFDPAFLPDESVLEASFYDTRSELSESPREPAEPSSSAPVISSATAQSAVSAAAESETASLNAASETAEPQQSMDFGQITLTVKALGETIFEGPFKLAENDTAFSLIKRFAGVQGLEFKSKSGGYVSKIGDYKEKAHGTNSGWIYSYNGTHATKGAASQKLSNGDTLLWHYEKNALG